MLVVGSRALAKYVDIGREPSDWDFIATIEQVNAWFKTNKENLAFMMPTQGGKYYHARDKDGMNYEFEIAWEGTTAEKILEQYLDLGDHCTDPIHTLLEDLYAIKMAHRYKKNSPHFQKTRKDILMMREALRAKGINPHDCLEIYKGFYRAREAESYTYSHPKLNVSKEDFFKGDGVQYVYDHDTIHETQACLTDEPYPFDVARPAYTYYMQDGAQVMTSSEKFFKCPEEVRLRGVYEEACVLALERSQIPFAFVHEDFVVDPELAATFPTAEWSFLFALEKVCTSITSGWFREYAWENYDKVVALYREMGENDYVERFKRNAHLLKPFEV